MQKARGQAFVLRRIALPPLVGKRFQVLFHSPHRGSFRLSLTVLVHYRSPGNIYPWGVVPPDSHGVSRVPWYLGTLAREISTISPTGLSPSVAALSRAFSYRLIW